MISDMWHSEFNPAKFLSRVRLSELIERNETYNENLFSGPKCDCILCEKPQESGILLSDKSFLCEACFSEVALISHPEKYELQRRLFLVEKESRRLAWDAFRTKFEYIPHHSSLVFFGLASILLIFISPAWLMLSLFLLVVGYSKNSADKRETKEWQERKDDWEQRNPAPTEPALKHFHDPTADLTNRDQKILKVFNHWPGYPPFWKYLRSIVINRDLNMCQVTGCPSRLELHVHHMRPISEGGTHIPDNLVSLCAFHHALEPERGHERIWGDVKTKFFTLVCAHERNNRGSSGIHQVKAHLRRLELIKPDELQALANKYGFCCPSCGGSKINFDLDKNRNLITAKCPNCNHSTQGPQQLTEETGPLLAEILGVTRNKGRWKARWEMLSERKSTAWGTWSSRSLSHKRKQHKKNIETLTSAPPCPICRSSMRLVRPWKKDQKWKPFWGCKQHSVTGCKGNAKYFEKEN